MPKLIIKQNNPAAQQSSIATWFSIGGLLVLLATVAAGAFFFSKTPLPGSELEPLAFSSSTNESAQNSYQSLHAVLGDLMTEYEGLAARGIDDYQKNLMLQGKAESILGHLDKMDVASGQLGLNVKESGEVTDRHQFYKDFWQAKLHFRELRVSRFENRDAVTDDQQDQAVTKKAEVSTAMPEQAEVADADDASVETAEQVLETAPQQEAVNSVAAEAVKQIPDEQTAEVQQQAPAATGETKKKSKFQFAKPSEGMEMPAGFCDLNNPGDSCKPDVGVLVGSDLPALDDLSLPNDLTDLPALDDLPLPDLALPEALPPLPDEALPLPDDNIAVADDSQPKKPKFQFAKPPEGMEMPAGFCDLSNPENSCKPEEGGALVGSDLPALDDLPLPADLADLPALDDLPLPDLALPKELPPLPDDNVAVVDGDQPKKPKFQFAKPPEGMEMPAGFCDLSNPDNSCKPDAGALAGSDLPALNDLPLPADLADLPALDDLALPELPVLDELPPLPKGDLLSDVDQPALNEAETAVVVEQNKL